MNIFTPADLIELNKLYDDERSWESKISQSRLLSLTLEPPKFELMKKRSKMHIPAIERLRMSVNAELVKSAAMGSTEAYFSDKIYIVHLPEYKSYLAELRSLGYSVHAEDYKNRLNISIGWDPQNPVIEDLMQKEFLASLKNLRKTQLNESSNQCESDDDESVYAEIALINYLIRTDSLQKRTRLCFDTVDRDIFDSPIFRIYFEKLAKAGYDVCLYPNTFYEINWKHMVSEKNNPVKHRKRPQYIGPLKEMSDEELD